MLSHEGFLKKLYKFVSEHLQYKNTIMNQFNIHDFYNIF